VAVGVYTPEEIADSDSSLSSRTERDMGAADVVPPPPADMPPGMLESAQEAAKAGRTEFADYWRGITPSARTLLAPHLDDLKAKVEKANAAPVDVEVVE
jgi:hypothetical protein